MKKSPLLTLFLVVFIDLLGFGIVIPILPYYAKTFGASAFTLGWLMASFSIAQFIFSPLWGKLSDQWGRRPVLLLTILGGACCLAASALATQLWILFIARILGGVFAANISTASAYISDITTEENRAKGMGVIGAGFGLGFIFGPAIGGILSIYGYSTPLLVGALLGLINFVFAFFVLPESLKDKNSTGNRPSRKEAFGLALAKNSTAIPILLFFLSTLAFTQLEVVFALYVLQKFTLGARDAGWMLAGMGLVSAFLQGGLIGKLARKFGEVNLATLGFFCFFVFLGVIPMAANAKTFAFLLMGVAIGNGLVNPSLSSLVSKSAAPNQRGLIMGIYQSGGSLARIIGPPLAGVLFDYQGTASPIFLSSIVMFAALIITMVTRKRL